MQSERRHFIFNALAAGVALGASGSVLAQVAGRDYTPINPPQPTDDPAKIEVVEFFSYGCPHCNDFHPLLSAWAAKLPADVVLKRVPVSFNSYFAMIAPLYYALEVTGDLARLDANVFKTIHGEGNRLADPRSRTEWAQKNGVNVQKFEDAYKSFGVMSKVKRGDQMTSAFKIQGVPALAVDGKYLVGGKDFNDTLAITDRLIAKVRAEKGKK
jgi:thiol:disulfide interchange protein DsbA